MRIKPMKRAVFTFNVCEGNKEAVVQVTVRSKRSGELREYKVLRNMKADIKATLGMLSMPDNVAQEGFCELYAPNTVYKWTISLLQKTEIKK